MLPGRCKPPASATSRSNRRVSSSSSPNSSRYPSPAVAIAARPAPGATGRSALHHLAPRRRRRTPYNASARPIRRAHPPRAPPPTPPAPGDHAAPMAALPQTVAGPNTRIRTDTAVSILPSRPGQEGLTEPLPHHGRTVPGSSHCHRMNARQAARQQLPGKERQTNALGVATALLAGHESVGRSAFFRRGKQDRPCRLGVRRRSRLSRIARRRRSSPALTPTPGERKSPRTRLGPTNPASIPASKVARRRRDTPPTHRSSIAGVPRSPSPAPSGPGSAAASSPRDPGSC